MSPAPKPHPSPNSPCVQPYSSDATLTATQHHVLALLAEGYSITHAAAEAGIHRNTIRNWRRTDPSFAREIECAVREQALVWHEYSVQLAPNAAVVLEDILLSPATPPALRFRAAQAILKAAADPDPKRVNHFSDTAAAALLVTAVHQSEIENNAQSCTISP